MPLPRLALSDGTVSFFELEVLEEGAIGIGVGGVGYYKLDAMPGWGRGSVGYHGDGMNLPWVR